jgi:hypothetical protein
MTFSAAAARRARTVSRRIARWWRTGRIHRRVAASPRLVSHPNAIGSRRTGRKRMWRMNRPNSPVGILPVSTSVLPVRPGGKLSNASQRRERSARAGPDRRRRGVGRAAGVVADEGDVAQVEAVEELGDQLGDPGQRQVGVGAHRVVVCRQGQRRCHAPVIGGQVGITSFQREASISSRAAARSWGPGPCRGSRSFRRTARSGSSGSSFAHAGESQSGSDPVREPANSVVGLGGLAGGHLEDVQLLRRRHRGCRRGRGRELVPLAAWSQGGEGADAVGHDAPGGGGVEGNEVEFVRDAGVEVELDREPAWPRRRA